MTTQYNHFRFRRNRELGMSVFQGNYKCVTYVFKHHFIKQISIHIISLVISGISRYYLILRLITFDEVNFQNYVSKS